MANERFRWEHAIRESDLPPSTRHVLLTMATYMDRDGMNCYPSQEELGRACGMTSRTVRRHVDAAIEAGWLLKIRQGRHVGRGASYTNVYQPWIPSAGGHGRPAAISQEDTGGPQEDTGDPAGGHGRPPTMSDHSKRPARANGFCHRCTNTGWLPAERHDDGSLQPLQRCPDCQIGVRTA